MLYIEFIVSGNQSYSFSFTLAKLRQQADTRSPMNQEVILIYTVYIGITDSVIHTYRIVCSDITSHFKYINKNGLIDRMPLAFCLYRYAHYCIAQINYYPFMHYGQQAGEKSVYHNYTSLGKKVVEK